MAASSLSLNLQQYIDSTRFTDLSAQASGANHDNLSIGKGFLIEAFEAHLSVLNSQQVFRTIHHEVLLSY